MMTIRRSQRAELRERMAETTRGPSATGAGAESIASESTTDDLVEECPNASQTYKENIIFVGSEEHYDSFWLKMMFIAPAFSLADRGLHFRTADKTTIAFVDVGYTRAEKLPLELLRTRRGVNIVRLRGTDAAIRYINNRPTETEECPTGKLLIQDVAFFCHGTPGRIALNYGSTPAVDINSSSLSRMGRDVFLPEGRIYSYACRTGVSESGEEFSSDDAAKPEESLAQKMADYFRVSVYAFLTRSFYGNVLRERSDSERISTALRTARLTREGSIIDIPPHHEGLPHPGLAEGGWFSSTDEEGTNEYALWRKIGAISMPVSGDTPTGLSRGLQQFNPR